MFLLDTNVLSEIRKGDRCNPHVAAWFASVAAEQLYLSVLVVGEIREGIERLRRREISRAAALERWLAELCRAYTDRLLSIDLAVAETWGRLYARRNFPVMDSLLAATAVTHRMTLVTRNLKDVRGTGVAALNPFEFRM
jgi:toxin FitB